MSLKGGPQLKARLKALGKPIFKPAGKEWADEVVRLARQRVPNRNTRYSKGRLHDSIRRKTATQNKAVVTAFYDAYFVDAGVKPHSLKTRSSRPKGRGSFAKAQRTIFAATARKGHPGYKARPFRARSARDALAKSSPLDAVVAAWNSGA
jgi:hypothetical protein